MAKDKKKKIKEIKEVAVISEEKRVKAPIKDAEVEKPLPQPKPEEPAKPLISLAVFLTICGIKPDQSAGFKYHATKNNLGPMPVSAWREEYSKFLKKPTK